MIISTGIKGAISFWHPNPSCMKLKYFHSILASFGKQYLIQKCIVGLQVLHLSGFTFMFSFLQIFPEELCSVKTTREEYTFNSYKTKTTYKIAAEPIGIWQDVEFITGSMLTKFKKDLSKGVHFRGKVNVLWQTDGWTDEQTDGQTKTNMSPICRYGGIKTT